MTPLFQGQEEDKITVTMTLIQTGDVGGDGRLPLFYGESGEKNTDTYRCKEGFFTT